MEVGNTKSNRSSVVHYITGTIVFLTGYSVVMFAIRDWLLHSIH